MRRCTRSVRPASAMTPYPLPCLRPRQIQQPSGSYALSNPVAYTRSIGVLPLERRRGSLPGRFPLCAPWWSRSPRPGPGLVSTARIGCVLLSLANALRNVPPRGVSQLRFGRALRTLCHNHLRTHRVCPVGDAVRGRPRRRVPDASATRRRQARRDRRAPGLKNHPSGARPAFPDT
jgi:hypothetical protein